jgi:hypothetical protein
MSWLYSQVLVEEYLVANSLDGEQSAPLNGTDTHGTFWSPDKMTDALKPSRSGMTFKPLTENLGAGLLMWYLEDSRARTSLPLEKAQESKEKEAVCGNTWRESSVKFDQNTLSWKTHLCLWEEDLAPSSLTLPKWGMMQSGVLWERIMSPLHTDETESGSLLPTPTCADATMGAILNDNTKLITLKSGKLRKISNQGVSGSIGLARTVAMWPTPQARDYKGSSDRSLKGLELDLPTKVKMWPTPTCHLAKEQDSPTESTRNTPSLTHLARGGDKTQPRHLNPTWVEWLMGWPLGWTDLKPLETDKCHNPQNSHGIH